MAELDAEMKAIAAYLTDTYGKDIVIVRETIGPYDPVTGTTPTVEMEYSVKGSPPKDYMTENIEGTLIQSGDTVIDVPAISLSIVPTVTDQVVMDGTRWNIVEVGRLYGGESVAAYRLHLRQ